MVALLADLGYSGTQFGVASITVGKVPAILGGALGGLLTARWGISRALWLLGIFQALSILGYWVAALPGAWYGTIYLATLGESLAGQMGSAAFMAFHVPVRQGFGASTAPSLHALRPQADVRLPGAGWRPRRLRHLLFLSFWPPGPPSPAALGPARGAPYRGGSR
jgi:hypothetical protein